MTIPASLRHWYVFAVALVWGMTGAPVSAQTDIQLAPAGDISPPMIRHTPAKEPAHPGKPVTITATVTDNNGVKQVVLFYRSRGQQNYRPVVMQPTDTDVYSVTIAAQDVTTPNIEYYIQATDIAGNTILRAGELFPLKLTVTDTDTKVTETDTEATALGSLTGPAPATQPPPASLHDAAPPETRPSAWKWILGALAVGAIAALTGGGGDDPGPATGGAAPPGNTTDVTFNNTPVPVQ